MNVRILTGAIVAFAAVLAALHSRQRSVDATSPEVASGSPLASVRVGRSTIQDMLARVPNRGAPTVEGGALDLADAFREWCGVLTDVECGEDCQRRLGDWVLRIPADRIPEFLALGGRFLTGDPEQLWRRMLLHRWVDVDPTTALEAARSHPATLGEGYPVDDMLGAWLHSHPGEATEWLATHPSGSSGPTMTPHAVFELASTDPHAAVAWLGAVPEGPGHDRLKVDLALGWARQDIGGAVAWASGLPEGERRNVVGALIPLWVESDFAEAARFVVGTGPGPERAEWMAAVAGHGASVDPVGVREWLETLEKGAERDAASVEFVSRWAETSPREAAACAWHLVSVGGPIETVLGVIANGAIAEPGMLGEWVAGFPDGDVRRQAVDALVSQWSIHDPARAGRWLQSLPQGDVTPDQLGRVAESLFLREPMNALALVSTIGDAAERIGVAGRLRSLYPDAARWPADIPSGVRERLGL